jgi:hypothetical protein
MMAFVISPVAQPYCNWDVGLMQYRVVFVLYLQEISVLLTEYPEHWPLVEEPYHLDSFHPAQTPDASVH